MRSTASPVSGRELREKVGADADSILRLSYLGGAGVRRLFARAAPEGRAVRTAERRSNARRHPRATPSPSAGAVLRRYRRSSGDRVRVFGDVVVNEGEEVSGQVVAVLGSVRIDGEVGHQVVAVLGTVELGPHAVVHGDVVTVGGRLRRAPGAQVRGSVTEVSLGDLGARSISRGCDGWGPFHFGGFGPVTRLVGTTFRLVLLALVACLALVVARRAVEGSAQRVADEPVRATLIGLVAWVLFVPVFMLVAHRAGDLVHRDSAAAADAVCGAVPDADGGRRLQRHGERGRSVGAAAIRDRRRRPAFADVCLGILIILLPVLIARVVAFGGWTLSPIMFLLVATGLAVEFLAWSGGFGAVLTNAFSRWQATRGARPHPSLSVTP